MRTEDLDLSAYTAMVCGSSQGIGKAAAEALARMGARVILVARNEDRLKEVLQEVRSINDRNHSYLVADFSHPDTLDQVLKGFTSNDSAQILINNTGGPPAGKAIDADIEDFRIAFNQHLICNHLLAKHLIPGMKKAGFGRIINVISTSVKQPLANLGVSNTVRGAVANWAKTLARELGPYGITVNNVLPGATDTGRLTSIIERKAGTTGADTESVRKAMAGEVPLQRIGKPEEVANGIAFLASKAASYISGINLPVDGGRTSSL